MWDFPPLRGVECDDKFLLSLKFDSHKPSISYDSFSRYGLKPGIYKIGVKSIILESPTLDEEGIIFVTATYPTSMRVYSPRMTHYLYAVKSIVPNGKSIRLDFTPNMEYVNMLSGELPDPIFEVVNSNLTGIPVQGCMLLECIKC